MQLILGNERILFDFFDEQGIYVAIVPEHYKNGINWNWQLLWRSPGKEPDTFVLNGGTCFDNNPEYLTRIQAENDVFTKAFDILEKLTNQRNQFSEDLH